MTVKERFNGSAKLIPIYIAITTGLITGFVAWGKMQNQVETHGKIIDGQEIRLRTAETHVAVDDQRFQDIKAALDRIESHQHR